MSKRHTSSTAARRPSGRMLPSYLPGLGLLLLGESTAEIPGGLGSYPRRWGNLTYVYTCRYVGRQARRSQMLSVPAAGRMIESDWPGTVGNPCLSVARGPISRSLVCTPRLHPPHFSPPSLVSRFSSLASASQGAFLKSPSHLCPRLSLAFLRLLCLHLSFPSGQLRA